MERGSIPTRRPVPWRPVCRFALLVLVICAGCQQNVGRRVAQKPALELESGLDELDTVLEQLREERHQLRGAMSRIRRLKEDSLRRFAQAAGDDYDRLLSADPLAISLYVSQPDSHEVVLHAQELAQHAAHVELIAKRAARLDDAVSQGEAARRIRQNFVSLGTEVPPNHELTTRLSAIANQQIDLPESLSIDEVGNYLAGELAVAREVTRRREEAERHARIVAERRLAAARAQREAERQAAIEAERERVEAEARRERTRRNAAAALKLYADGYHAFFRGQYVDAERLLDDAIRLDATDPRYFYYRGLARKRLGKSRLAMEDFRAGGEVERGSSSNAGHALERIQGQERLMVERFRP